MKMQSGLHEAPKTALGTTGAAIVAETLQEEQRAALL